MEKHKKLAVTEEEKSINIVDLFVYLVVHWKWYLLSILLFGGCFWYIYCKTPFTYSRVAIVMIKTPANSRSTMQLNNSDFTGLVNVASEILQFKSKELMRKVIDRLQANISYTVYDGLRPVELYTESPVRVTFLDAGMDEAHSLSVTPKSRQQVELADFSRGMEQRKVVNLNDTIHTALGRLIVFAAENYGESSFGKPVLVTCKPPEEMVSFWLYNLAIKQMSGDAALLHLTMNDLSPTRAADILDMLITIYNEEAIKDKNRIAVNTAEFTKERLQMYIALKNAAQAKLQLDKLEETANLAKNDSISEDLLYTKANYYYTFGLNTQGDACFRKLINQYKEKKFPTPFLYVKINSPISQKKHKPMLK